MIERYIDQMMACVQELYDALTLECDRASAAQLGTLKEYQKIHRKIQSYHRAVHNLYKKMQGMYDLLIDRLTDLIWKCIG